MDPVPPDEPVHLGQGDPAADLSAWTAQARIDAAAADRARQRWLQRQADEDTTLAGLLVELAERGQPVQVRTRADHGITGLITTVGTDFVVLGAGATESTATGSTFVPLATLASIRPSPGEPVTDGPAAVSVMMSFVDGLVELAADRPTVLAVTGGERLRGELRAAGRDVATLVPDHGPAVHVAIDALDHLSTVAR